MRRSRAVDREGRLQMGFLGGFFYLDDGADGSFGEVLGTEPEKREGMDDGGPR